MGKKNRDTINPEKHSRFVQPGPRSFQVTFYPETLLPPPPPPHSPPPRRNSRPVGRNDEDFSYAPLSPPRPYSTLN